METAIAPVKRIVGAAVQNVTPTRLRLLLVLNCVLSLVFCIAAVSTVEQHTHVVKTIGIDAAPSVIAAHNIKISLERMDADLCDQILHDLNASEQNDLLADFERSRQEVSKQFVAAAKNITYGQLEQIPLEKAQIALGQYEMQAQAVRDMHKLEKRSDALQEYGGAVQTLESELIPSIEALNRANADALDTAYAQEKSATNLSRGMVWVLGAVLFCFLTYTHLYLSKRFRRRINVPILLSMVCLAIFLNHLTSSLEHNSALLKVAKEDSYDSILALLEARSNAYAADVYLSRGLLDHEKWDKCERSFLDRSAKIASLDNGSQFKETIEQAKRQIDAGVKVNLPGFNGSLADELKNITFPGESETALEALQAFYDYTSVVEKVRDLEHSGAHSAAARINLDYGPSGSRQPFIKFDDALTRLLHINQVQLEKSLERAFQTLVGLEVTAQGLCLLIMVSACLGILPRVDEYVHCAPKAHQ